MCEMKTKRINTRRGFTLVEAVICIVVIVLISIAAITAAMATGDIVRRSDDRNKANDQAEMIMACYRTEDFPAALALCGIEGYTGGNFTVYYDEDFNVIGIEQPNDNNYYCRIDVTVGQNSVGVVAVHRDGEEFYKTEEWLG